MLVISFPLNAFNCKGAARIRTVALGAILCTALLDGPVRAQSSRGSAGNWTPPRTADGQPNISGMWNNIGSFYAPLQRPAKLGERANYTEAELKAILQESVDTKIENSDRGTGAGPIHWYEPQKSKTNYSVNWLIKDPADGRLPAMKPAPREKLAYVRAHEYDSWEFFDPGDRCIYLLLRNWLLHMNIEELRRTLGSADRVCKRFHSPGSSLHS